MKQQSHEAAVASKQRAFEEARAAWEERPTAARKRLMDAALHELLQVRDYARSMTPEEVAAAIRAGRFHN